MATKKKGNPAVELIAGGTAGMFEALCCHPLDTIKVRMQLRRKENEQKKDEIKSRTVASNKAETTVVGGNKANAQVSTVQNQQTVTLNDGKKVTLKPQRGFIGTGVEIVRKESPISLYKGLGAVLTGITPKMGYSIFILRIL
jgi:solute carrier family 25 citrate transporter 1